MAIHIVFEAPVLSWQENWKRAVSILLEEDSDNITLDEAYCRNLVPYLERATSFQEVANLAVRPVSEAIAHEMRMAMCLGEPDPSQEVDTRALEYLRSAVEQLGGIW